jgi:glutathione S-transferase
MHELILHHYGPSPFARKVRAVLGFKQLSWRSALVPPVPPRPALALLAGGYRRIPVLQYGADIFCDSNLILRVLDTLHPTPSLRAGHDTLTVPVSQWFEPRMFTVFSGLRFRTADDLQGAFADQEERAKFGRDRAAFMAPLMDIAKNRENGPTAAAHASLMAGWIEHILEQGGPFLQGAAPSHADFSAFHPFHWLKGRSAQRDLLSGFSQLWAWVDRMDALGEGQSTPVESVDALAAAKAARPAYQFASSLGTVGDPALGTEVSVAPSDYGLEPVVGTLVSIGLDHISLARTTEQTGDVVVHFPRWGYRALPHSAT